MENGVKVFRYGEPIETGIIQGKMTATELNADLEIEFKKNNSSINLLLSPEDIVYGLGANLGGINKRGRTYESYCTDDPSHTEDKTKLYGAHNFFIISGDVSRGYFIDYPSMIKYDVGFKKTDILNIEITDENFTIYIIDGKSPSEVTSKFLTIIGRAYIPPKWGFGYFQSRWGYKDKGEILDIYNSFKENDIPIDGIYLDLDYMENFKDFSISDERFSDFKEFVTDLKKEGLYLVPIIDAGVKVEPGYDVYEEGIKGDHFCKDINGDPYVAAVWPGKVHFPDFLKDETQHWFGSKYKLLTDAGIEGVWNDMNEPAIFYDTKALDEAIEYAIESKGKNLDIHSFFSLKDKFTNLANKDAYYKSFYHLLGDKTLSNDEVHNLYGFYMTKSANLGLTKLLENKRFLLISRASSIGMHRFGGMWTGDNSSWWSHLELNIKMMPSLNMCGFFYTGADTGGFGGNCSGELLTRWLQFSVFTPLLRNHSAIGCRNQEPFSFDEQVTKNSKNIIKVRYRLLPYIYSEYMKAVSQYELMFKPLAFEYGESLAKETEDQLLFGNELMLTPVHSANQKGRYVFLPEKMAEITLGSESLEVEIKSDKIHYMDYGLENIKFYLRKNSILPLVRPSQNVKNMDTSMMDVVAYVDEKAHYTLLDDDGITYDFEKGEKFVTNISIEWKKDDYEINVSNNNSSVKELNFKVIDSRGNMTVKKINL
ncbi:TIM-barrel domain-containing protein [Alkalicella caledoniensis]|nr:TIM-barrel domain-containing protein [Alkalicella caledoniensis]